MTEIKAFLPGALPPYIHSADTLAKRYWGQTFATLPVFFTACLTGHAEILRVLLISLVSAVAFDLLAVKFFRKKESLRTGETVLIAVLFSLLMPSRCPSEIVILGVFFAVVAGRELFGGSGAAVFHPCFLARVFLQVSFPAKMTEPMLLAAGGNVWVLAALGAGFILLLIQRGRPWGIPALFITACFLFAMAAGGKATLFTLSGGVLLITLFLLTDLMIFPLTRRGTAFFVLGAAFLSSWIDPGAGGFSVRAAGYAILLMELARPWLDLGFKAVSYKTPYPMKATY